MSLRVPAPVLAQAERGEVDDDAFVAVVQESLPYAYGMVERLSTTLTAGDEPYAANLTEPPTEEARGQLLRALASDAIRGALERHFGVRLAFQNCHKVIALRPTADAGLHAELTSTRAQILNQSPELVNC